MELVAGPVVQTVKIRVLVKPRSRKDEVAKAGDGEFVVSVRAAARDGKANQALKRLLATYFSVPKSCVSILRGEASRTKRVEIVFP